jgi:hypothetical protein
MGTLPFRDPLRGADSPATAVSCPFHDGPQTLDLLLCELRHDSPDLLDPALELRGAMTAGTDPDACLHLLFALRARLAGRHHLAFYRVRTWVRRRIVAEVRPDRASPWVRSPLPLDCVRYEELRNRCLATLAGNDRHWPATATFRLIFADSGTQQSPVS